MLILHMLSINIIKKGGENPRTYFKVDSEFIYT